MKFKGAIFDQDGLLFDTESLYQRCWLEAGRRMGVEIDPSLPKLFTGRGVEQIRGIIRDSFPPIDVEAYFTLASTMAREMQLSQVPPKKEGLIEMLGFCRANGIRTSVASSAPRHVVQHNLSSAGVIDYFDAITTGDEVKRGKPNPDIFLLAASRLGLAPAECVVFEDAPTGIQGAHAAGCGAVMIPDQIEPTDDIRKICVVHANLKDAIAVFG